MGMGADRVVVLGVGNIIHRDDGAGVHALRRLQDDPRVSSEVEFVDGGVRGLEILADVAGCSRLLLLDAIEVGEPPGTIVRLTGENLKGLPGASNVHQLAVADLLATLPLISESPIEVVLLGIQPAETGWGTELSDSVASNLQELVEAAAEQLQEWSEAPVTLA